MKKHKSFKHFLLSRGSEKGQTLVLMAFVLIAMMVLVAFAIDVAMMIFLKIEAETNVARACIAAAETYRIGGDPYAAYVEILERNGYTSEKYFPKEGTGFNLTRGLENLGTSWVSAVLWDEPTIGFFRLVGVESFPVLGQSRCVRRSSGGLAPIAVRESAVLDSIIGNPPEEYAILGRDPKWDLADVESGENFRGAVYLHMWCTPSDDPNCPNVEVFLPLTEEPPSPATQKKLVQDCFRGINCSIWPDTGERLPIVPGTSNAQICKAFQDGGWKVGDKVVVIVFDGEVYSPGPTYGSWENIAVVGYAVYEITAFEPSEKNCNHVIARLHSPEIYTSLDDIPSDVILLKSREIQWDYQGAIPWN